MTALAMRMLRKYYDPHVHPYRIFERDVASRLRPEHTLLDAGCGRTAPILAKYVGRAQRLIGIDLVEFRDIAPGIEVHNCDLAHIDLEDASVDIVMSRSVMEHVQDPERVYSEIHRVLRPGGHFIFLTPNLWDYASLIAKVVPNRFHPAIVARTEGREPEDVFPVCYLTNTRRAVSRWADRTGFEIVKLEYLGSYPVYFMFNAFLFMIATAYEKTTSRIDALRFLRGWIYVVLRKPALGLKDDK